MKKLFPLIIAGFLVLSGCSASVSEYEITNRDVGIVTGSAVGAGIGAIIGHQVGNAGEGVALGAAAGGILGGLVGYQEDKRDRDFERQDTILRRQQQELERQTRELEALKRQRYYDEQARVQGAKIVPPSGEIVSGRYGGLDYSSNSEEIALGNRTVKKEKGSARSEVVNSAKVREDVGAKDVAPVNYPEVSIKEPVSPQFDVQLAPGLKTENQENSVPTAAVVGEAGVEKSEKGAKYSGGYVPGVNETGTEEGNATAREDFRF